MFWSYQNQNVHTRTHTFCEVFTRYKDSSLPIQKKQLYRCIIWQSIQVMEGNYNIWTCHFLNFCVFFPQPQCTDFLFPSLHTTAPANTCSSNPLLPTPHSYHIFSSILLSNEKQTNKPSKKTPKYKRHHTHIDICHHLQENSAWDVCVLTYSMFLYSVQTTSPLQKRQMLSVQHTAHSRLDFKQQVLTFFCATQTLLKWFTVQISWKNKTVESENHK